jgi:chromosomal replication initiator protein
LRSRLEWGLITDIQMPTIEEKVAILQRKADRMGQLLSDDVACAIAQQPMCNVRELEGVLIRLYAFASLTNQAVNSDLVKKVVQRPHALSTRRVYTLEEIMEKVGKASQCSITQLRARSRSKEVARVRQVTMYMMKKFSDASLYDIGVFLRRKDHSTVAHAVAKVEQLLKSDAHIQALVERLEQLFGS